LISQTKIQVIIIDDSKSEKCEGRCGLDFSSPETFEFVAEHLNKLYGSSVQLEFLDLADPSTSGSHPEIGEMLKDRNLLLPLLLINGNLRISGYFDIYILQNAIQTDMEMELGFD
jgi:disulfide oxidoreductase YuzD